MGSDSDSEAKTVVKKRRAKGVGATPAPADGAVAQRPLWNDAAATPNLDAMRRALVVELGRHFPLDQSSTEVGVVLICGDRSDASMDWAGLVLTLPSVADQDDDEQEDGEEAGSLWVKPLNMDEPRGNDAKKKRANKRAPKKKTRDDLALVVAGEPPPLTLARPAAPVVRLSVSKESPVQQIDGAAIMDRLRFTSTELAPVGSGSSLGAVDDRGLCAQKGHDVSRSTVTRVYAFAPERRELAEELTRGLRATGGARPPRHTCLPSPLVSATVKKRKRVDSFAGDEYGGVDDTPGTVVFEGTSKQTARRGMDPRLPAPSPLVPTRLESFGRSFGTSADAGVCNPLFDEVEGGSTGGEGTLGDRAAAVLRDALQGSSAVELILPRADVMCALAEVNEMRSRLQEIRVRCRR